LVCPPKPFWFALVDCVSNYWKHDITDVLRSYFVFLGFITMPK
jgi:hypothetical protein